MAMIIYQIVILIGHGIKKEWMNILLQIPFSFLFGLFLDTNMYLTDCIQPTSFISCLIVLFAACLVHAMGVFLQVSANVSMMSAEAFVYYTCKRWNLQFWKTKIKFDMSMVMLTIFTSLMFDFSILSVTTAVREGTVVDALLVGRIYHFYTKYIYLSKFFNNSVKWLRIFESLSCLNFLEKTYSHWNNEINPIFVSYGRNGILSFLTLCILSFYKVFTYS